MLNVAASEAQFRVERGNLFPAHRLIFRAEKRCINAASVVRMHRRSLRYRHS